MNNKTNIFRLRREPNDDPYFEKQAQLVEYDDRMRQEEIMYAQLLTELKQTNWFERHVARDVENGCNVDQICGRAECPQPEYEATRLTQDEILFGSDLTMDRVIFEQCNRTTGYPDIFVNAGNESNSGRTDESGKKKIIFLESVQINNSDLVLYYWK